MSKQVFVSLPVTDVARSTAFYEAIGFTKNAAFSNEQASALQWSDTFSVMVASHDFYATLTPKQIVDPRTSSQALFALAMDSREAVDAISAAAVAAGGREAHGAEDEGFLYSRGFEDPDGHGWGPMFMDMSAASEAA
ncbi:VOC family protein [Sphingomonas aracearum]|uniref:Lactoylglutathione lyase n=1 Tax=Sphingomonas aracearum TaxID=2283317 RepID=A0A369VVI9_9SPHN|nr:VOC family protein [Sphingomonas aracearum]RDE05869.1 lactoylglutathione lyase [Sphingomonas aracearum]